MLRRSFSFALSLAVGSIVACGGSKEGATGGAGGTSSATSTASSASSSAAKTSSSVGVGGNFTTVATSGSGGGACVDPNSKLIPAGSEAALAPAYTNDYAAFDLGAVPGMPSGHLGGCVIAPSDPNTLYLAGDSEDTGGGLYKIQVERDKCGHIDGFVGSATLVATAPYIDANLLFLMSGTLVYTEWPVGKLGQILPGASMPSSDTMLPLPGGDSPGGLGFVPSYLQAKGELRALGWPKGSWYHVAFTESGGLLDVSSMTVATTLTNGPGGFAYVPPGSPDFAKPSLIVAEWSNNTVATYQSDMNGDPIPSTRADFFTTFPAPWGAYFEPVTGDYLFLTWGTTPDRVYLVQGFVPPPPPPA